MRKALLPALAAALAAGCGALRTQVRYSPARPVYALAPARLAKVASISFKDSSRGFESAGAGVMLARPFFDTFRDAAREQLAALGVTASGGAGAAVELDLKHAELKRGQGLIAELSATVAYTLRARLPDGASCTQDVTGWASRRDTLAGSPAAQTLEDALGKALDNLGPAVADSCLYSPAPAPGGSGLKIVAPSRGRIDGKLLAVAVGVGRYRDAALAAPSAAEDARAFAAAAKAELGAAGDRVFLLTDADATLADLNKTLGRLIGDRVALDGRVVVYFAGRTARDSRGAVLLPYDADPAYPAETGYPLERLYEELGRLPARVTLVLDAGTIGALPRAPKNLTVLSGAGVTKALLADLRAGNGDLDAAVAAARGKEAR